VIKVAFIGAGSVEFTRNSAERLSWAARLARRIVAQTCWRRTGRCCPPGAAAL